MTTKGDPEFPIFRDGKILRGGFAQAVLPDFATPSVLNAAKTLTGVHSK